MTQIIYKIIDERQYKHSQALSHLNLENVVGSYEKIYVSSKNDFSMIFEAANRCESDLLMSDNNFYIVPVFYNHAERLDTLENWKFHIDKFINDNVELLSKSNVVLAIYDLFETSRHFVESVNEIAHKFSFDILAVTANKKFNSNMPNLTVVYNDTWMETFKSKESILDYRPNKLYINFNRVARHHRCVLMEKIIDNNLLSNGYNTWGDVYGAFSLYKEKNPYTKIEKQTFDVLDIEDLSSINPNFSIPELHCTKSFLFLNTESNIESDQLFFSEKVYKPIAIGMPFMTLGNPGTLQDLRTRGFVTFSDWWDEGYDLDLDLNSRIEIIIKNLKKLSQYKSADLIRIRKEMQDILEHNLNLYTVLQRKHWLSESLTLYVQGLI